MSVFHFKKFSIQQNHAALKVGTDAMVLAAHLSPPHGSITCLDVGCGTGVLSAVIATEYSPQRILAIDIDEGSILDAKENLHPFSNVEVKQQDFFSLEEDSFDFIVSNPPFYEHALLSGNDKKNQSKHAQDFNLLNFFKKCAELLFFGGHLQVILPSSQANYWMTINEQIGLYAIQQTDVFGKPGERKRVIITFSKQKQKLEVQSFVVRDEDGTYTEGYIDATRHLHGKAL